MMTTLPTDATRRPDSTSLPPPIEFVDHPRFVHHHPEVLRFEAILEERERHAAESVAAGSHLDPIARMPPLSPDEAALLFFEMNFLKYRAARERERPNADHDRVTRLLHSARRIRDHLVESNGRLVLATARSFVTPRLPFDDVVAEGLAVLLRAVERFDVHRGFRFGTYLTRSLRNRWSRLAQGRERFDSRFQTGLDETEPPSHESTTSTLCAEEIREVLDETEFRILSLRFGLDGDRRHRPYTQIADELGLSASLVRRIANRALEKLERELADVR